jgi:hypothetical protein
MCKEREDTGSSQQMKERVSYRLYCVTFSFCFYRSLSLRMELKTVIPCHLLGCSQVNYLAANGKVSQLFLLGVAIDFAFNKFGLKRELFCPPIQKFRAVLYAPSIGDKSPR